MKEYILGISAFYHDSAASLLCNGEIVAAAQEERFSRLKGDSGFPLHAVKYCLESQNLTIEDVDHIVFYDKPILKFDRIISSYLHRAPRGLFSFLKAIPIWLKSKLWTESLIQKKLGTKKTILFSQHHFSHAASAYYPSPYKHAAILTVDGAGEWTTATIGVGSSNSMTILKKLEFPHSLGLLYSAFTYYCGFRVNSGEYKLMGLAPYGTPLYTDKIKKEMINIFPDGSFHLNQEYFNYISGLKMISKKFEKTFGYPALKSDQKPTQFYMDIAASIQEVTNDIMILMAKEAKRLTQSDNLCLAGGVSLNCVANEKVLKQAGFDSVWVQPAAGDAGGALGAALNVHYRLLNNERIHQDSDFQKGSYLGPDFSSETIQKTLKEYSAVYEKYRNEELFTYIAKAISEGHVVGWFQGRSEFGPRALGNRSILGDPRNPQMQKDMNLKIKFRESFRPFAPSVLEEHLENYFDFPQPSPYMLFTSQIKKHQLTGEADGDLQGFDRLKDIRSTIPAVTHVDNSARIQTVSKETNPRYYRLIQEFYELTKCPLLINTSFNVRGEPIVNSPEDAYRCFMGTNIDVLVLDNYVLLKDKQPQFTGMKQWQKSLIKD